MLFFVHDVVEIYFEQKYCSLVRQDHNWDITSDIMLNSKLIFDAKGMICYFFIFSMSVKRLSVSIGSIFSC